MVLIKSAVKNEGKVNDKVELVAYEVEAPVVENEEAITEEVVSETELNETPEEDKLQENITND